MLLLSICCWAAAAGGSDEAATAPASDPIAALDFLASHEDWPGLRTHALLARHAATDARTADRARWYQHLADLRQGQALQAVSGWQALAHEAEDPAVADSSRLAAAAGWLEVQPDHAREGARRLLDADVDDATREEARRVLARSQVLLGAFDEVDRARFADDPAALRRLDHPRWRRPGVAGALSLVLPGAGQLYDGAPRAALSAFVVNAAFATSAILLARDDKVAGAVTVGIIGLGFWSGNVYGAADGALRRNRRVRRDVLSAIPEPVLELRPR